MQMKVMCIYGAKQGDPSISNTFGETHVRKDEEIYEGQVYTVVRVIDWDGECYFLAEKPPTACYDAKRFIPLSDIDETELAKEREELQTV